MTSNANTMTNSVGPPLSPEDLEEVLLELNRFEKSPTTNIPNLLERYLVYVAQKGCAYFPWSKIKPLFRAKLDNVIIDFSNLCPAEEIPPVPNVDVFNFAGIRNKVFEQLDAFAGIPFTVQRLAELLTSPRRHYKRTDKFMRALEKNMLIVSTVEARANNNNNDSDSRNSYLMNGDYISNGNGNGTSSNENSPPHAHASSSSSSSSLNLNHSNSNGSSSSSQIHQLQRDNIEDELDAEMPEASSAGPSVRPTQAGPTTNEAPCPPMSVESSGSLAATPGQDPMLITDELDTEDKSNPDQSCSDSSRSELIPVESSEVTSESPPKNPPEHSNEEDKEAMEVESSSSEVSSEEISTVDSSNPEQDKPEDPSSSELTYAQVVKGGESKNEAIETHSEAISSTETTQDSAPSETNVEAESAKVPAPEAEAAPEPEAAPVEAASSEASSEDKNSNEVTASE